MNRFLYITARLIWVHSNLLFQAKSAEIFTLFKEKTGETEMTLKHILQLVQDRDPAKKPTTPKSTTPKSDVDENLVTLHALGDTHVTKDIK